MKVKISKITPEAVIPKYAKVGDVGLDLVATSSIKVDSSNYGYIEYGTGLRIEIPEDYVGLLFPRSSISNTGMILSNSVGVIDPGYRGEIKLRFRWIKDTLEYKIGDRIGQLVIMPVPSIELVESKELSETIRGDSGFGSTN